MSSCLVSGLPSDPLVDAEVWRYDLVLGTPATGSAPAQPFDLTGSDLAITFKTLTNQTVSTLSTDATWACLDGAITVTDAAAGKVSIVSDPWRRTYRVPAPAFGIATQVVVQGDVMRLLRGDPDALPEYLGYIRFPLRAGTTQWPKPATS